jgi:hypothetical protein
MDQDQSKDWRAICEAAANEVDPAKLMALISELTRALDARDQKRSKTSKENLEDKGDVARSLRSEPAL